MPDYAPDDYLSFRRGDCGLLAIALHLEDGLPVWGLFEDPEMDGGPHHIFAVDEDEMIDVDGRRPLEGGLDRYAGDYIRPLTNQEIEAISQRYGDDEYDYACTIAEDL